MNEAVNLYAKDAAERKVPDRESRLAAERISASFFKRRAAGKRTWRPETGGRERCLTGPKFKPRIGPHLQAVPKAIARRFSQL